LICGSRASIFAILRLDCVDTLDLLVGESELLPAGLELTAGLDCWRSFFSWAASRPRGRRPASEEDGGRA
jgi:hypothetical protein